MKISEIFTGAYKVTVRDDSSQYLLTKLGIEAEVVDDPVMYDNAWEKTWTSSLIKILESKSFDMNDLSEIDFSSKRVWLALRKWYFSKSWSDQIEIAMIKEIITYIEHAWWDIILLPHSFHKADPQANDYDFLSQFDYAITQSMQDTYWYYKDNKLDIVLAQRLHSMILSHVYSIPYVALSYSKKTRGQLKKLSR